MTTQHRTIIVLVVFMAICQECHFTDFSGDCVDKISTFSEKSELVAYLLKRFDPMLTSSNQCQAFEAKRIEYDVNIEKKDVPRTVLDTVEVKREVKFK